MSDPITYPIGTFVIVTKDDGSELKTYIRSEAWESCPGMKGTTWEQKVKGIAGGYYLSRIRLDPNPADDLWIPVVLPPPHGYAVLTICDDDASSIAVRYFDGEAGFTRSTGDTNFYDEDKPTDKLRGVTAWRHLPKVPRG